MLSLCLFFAEVICIIKVLIGMSPPGKIGFFSKILKTLATRNTLIHYLVSKVWLIKNELMNMLFMKQNFATTAV